MHAAALGAELQVKRVVVPPFSGVFSAWGMCLTEPRVDVVQTRITRTSETDAEGLGALFAALEREATSELLRDNPSARADLSRAVDARYHGQEHAVRVPIAAGALSLPEIESDFHAAHRQKYTFDLPDTPVELVTFHVSASRRPERAQTATTWAGGRRDAAPKGRRLVDYDAGDVRDTPVYERTDLAAGFAADGPIIVEEATTTTLVHPGQTLAVDACGNLVISV
jgi:N-methylhydantoinase A